MLSIFYKKDLDRRFKKHIYGRYDYLNNMINSYLYVIDDYYKSMHNYVHRPNMLVNLIEILNIDITLPENEVYNVLDATAIYEANVLKVVTGMNDNSKPHNSTCILNCNEYFLYTRDENFIFENKHYKELTPVECIYNTKKDIFLFHPYKYTDITDEDYFIYTIDPVKLGIQYYHWAKEQLEDKQDTDPARFVYQIVLTNAIPSIFKISLFNRFINSYRHNKNHKFKNYNPFEVRDFNNDIERMFKWCITLLNKTPMELEEVLHSIPSFINGNYLIDLQIPNGHYGRKNKWLVYLSRIDYIYFLLNNFIDTMDKDLVNDFKYELKLMDRNHYFEVYDRDTDNILYHKIKNIKRLLNM